MAISGTKSGWRPVISSEPQGSVVVPVPYSTLTNGLDDGAECTLSRSAECTDLRGVAHMQEG